MSRIEFFEKKVAGRKKTETKLYIRIKATNAHPLVERPVHPNDLVKYAEQYEAFKSPPKAAKPKRKATTKRAKK